MPRDRDIRTLDIAHLASLNAQGQIQLRPDFQRNAIWPTAAKSYLIDTIIHDRPVPLLFLQPFQSPQTGLPGYAVVDGQQRLSAIFDYLDDGFRLSGPDVVSHRLMRFSALPDSVRAQILRYGLVAEVLHSYSPAEIREIFVRLNKYGVRLSPQELRHAKGQGAFYEVVGRVGAMPFWLGEHFVSRGRDLRMRSAELAAELLILLAEAGPQDKKSVIDDYYVTYEDEFPEAKELVERLESYIGWISEALPTGGRTRFRKPVDLYAVVGALDRVSRQGERLSGMSAAKAQRALVEFELELKNELSSPRASRYLIAASRQTDNVAPRRTRIEILSEVLAGAVP